MNQGQRSKVTPVYLCNNCGQYHTIFTLCAFKNFLWVSRVGILVCVTKYSDDNVKYHNDIEHFMERLNKAEQSMT